MFVDSDILRITLVITVLVRVRVVVIKVEVFFRKIYYIFLYGATVCVVTP